MLRLLPKNEVAKRRSEEERQRMDEGLRIAERVDSLREIAVSDEAAIESYRVSALKNVQEQIDTLTTKLEQKRKELAEAEKRWQHLMETEQAPLDKQWLLFVSHEKARIEGMEVELARKLQSVENERSSLKEIESVLVTRETQLRKRENETAIALDVSQKERAEAQRTLDKARRTSENLIISAESLKREASALKESLESRITLADQREKELEERETAVLVKELLYYSPVKQNNHGT